MLSTLTLSSDQKTILRRAARTASRMAQRVIAPAEILDRILHDRDSLYTLTDSYYVGSPRHLANERENAAREAREVREARAFLRAEYRRTAHDGRNYPTRRAIDALAARLGRSVEHLDFEMRPPEWSRPSNRATGWWYKAGRKPRWRPLDDRSWPGRPEEISVEEKERRRLAREATFAADLEHERARLDALARERGVAITAFCPEHGQRLFRCECVRPKYHAYPSGYSYGDELRAAIFGEDAVNGVESPKAVLLFPKRSARRESVAA